MSMIQFTTLAVIGTDCTGSCISNYHTIMAMMAPKSYKSYYLAVINIALNDVIYEIQNICGIYLKDELVHLVMDH
jgi:hypothetical protein